MTSPPVLLSCLSLLVLTACGSQSHHPSRSGASDLAALFKAHEVTVLLDEEVDLDLDHLSAYWREGRTHKRFLLAEGDLDLEHGEWTSLGAAYSASEDFLNLTFSGCRNFSYAHPRNSMLMLGPKNTLAQQTQFLSELADPSARTIIVMTVTKLSGFPLSDKFKVVQYWTASTVMDSQRTRLTVGVKLFFMSETIFRRQIVGGTEAETKTLSESWARFLVNSFERLEL